MPEGSVSPDNTIQCNKECDDDGGRGGMDDDDDDNDDDDGDDRSNVGR
jgi:hypothetical protein